MKNVYLAQMPSAIDTQNVLYFPYSVGMLWAYAQTFDEIKTNYKLKEILFQREDITKLVNRMERPDILGISCYQWSMNYNQVLAREVKKRWPECLIIVGGPHVGKDDDNFFATYPDYDIAVYQEGEHTFSQLLLALCNNSSFESICGIGLNVNNSVVRTGEPTRINNLNVIPSPYLTGVFDEVVAAANESNIELNAILETNRGCPYQCTFCDWGNGVLGKVKKFSSRRVKKELLWLATNKISWIIMADANFGIYKDRDLEFTKFLVKLKKRYGFPKVVDTNWAKNQSKDTVEIAKILIDANMLRKFTSSVQSLNKDSLKAVKRVNMKEWQQESIQHLAKQYDITVNTDLIIGLPEETFESFNSYLFEMVSKGTVITASYLAILPNSEMNSPEYRQRYGFKTKHITKEYKNSTEVTEIVIETNTMSQKEMTLCLLYIWFIRQFHDTNYTTVFYKFFVKRYNWSCYEFYSKLIPKCFESAEHFPNKIISRYKNHIDDNLSAELDTDWYFEVQLHNQLGYINRDSMFSGLGNMLKSMLPDCDHYLVDDLIKLQMCSQINKQISNHEIITLQTNLYDYIYNNKSLVNVPTAYSVTNFNDNVDLSFGELLLRNKWTGKCNTVIKQVHMVLSNK